MTPFAQLEEAIVNNSFSPNQAQNTENKQPNPEQERLTLEIKERKWNVSWVKFVHLITPIAFFLVFVGAFIHGEIK